MTIVFEATTGKIIFNPEILQNIKTFRRIDGASNYPSFFAAINLY